MSFWSEMRGGKSPRKGTYFGIELEIEGVDSDDVVSLTDTGLCRAVSDGSLRNGLELVTVPLQPENIPRFAAAYEEVISQTEAVVNQRCSTHIHVNVSDMTLEQLKCFMWLTLAIEPVLMSTVSAYRQNNTYCYMTSNTTNIVSDIHNMLFNHFAFGSRQAPKYSAVGLYRFREYGTIEFRMFDGTLSASDIISWCTILGSIRDKAMSTTVESLIDIKIKDGLQSLLVANLPVSSQQTAALLELGVEMANNIFIKPFTKEELLAYHASLFPEEAPIEIVRGLFGALCLANKDNLPEFLGQFDVKEFQSQYTNMYDLFLEMTPTSPVAAADICVAIRNHFNI